MLRMDIHEIIQTFGTIAATSRALGVSRQSIYNWINGKRKMTKLRADDLKKALVKHTRASVA